MDKYIPRVGEKFYMRQHTGSYYVDLVKHPYTVLEVANTTIKAQRAKPIFDGPVYYDSMPVAIVPDECGEIVTLRWAPKKQRWQHAEYPGDTYPEVAHWGEGYQYFPYLD